MAEKKTAEIRIKCGENTNARLGQSEKEERRLSGLVLYFLEKAIGIMIPLGKVEGF